MHSNEQYENTTCKIYRHNKIMHLENTMFYFSFVLISYSLGIGNRLTYTYTI